MAFDYFIWQGVDSRNINNLIVKKNLKTSFASARLTDNVINGKNDVEILNKGIGTVDIPIEIMLTGTPSYGGLVGREAIEWFLYSMNMRDPVHKNKLRLSTETDWWREAYISAEVDIERLFEFGSATITFHCQGTRRKYDSASDNKYKPSTYEEVSFETTFEADVPPCSVARKPKVIIGFSSVSVTATAITIKVGSEHTAESGYFARQYSIAMNSMKAAIPSIVYPVIVFDFENDDYYVCNLDSTVTDVEYYLDKTHSLGSIVPYMLNMSGSLGNSADYYYDASTETESTETLALWHEIEFKGTTDFVLIQTPSHTTNLKAYIYYYPEVRSR